MDDLLLLSEEIKESSDARHSFQGYVRYMKARLCPGDACDRLGEVFLASYSIQCILLRPSQGQRIYVCPVVQAFFYVRVCNCSQPIQDQDILFSPLGQGCSSDARFAGFAT